MAGGYTLPAPAALETVRFPRMPFSCYAHGVQAQGNLGSGFTVISDLTGRSGVSFDSDSNWDRLESSTRLQKKVTEDFFLAGTSNFSDDFLTLSLDSSIFLFEKLTVDHEIVDGKSDDNRTIAKLQIQF